MLESYSIVDVKGQVIYVGNTNGTVDLSDLSAGCYYLTIANRHFRLIKNN